MQSAVAQQRSAGSGLKMDGFDYAILASDKVTFEEPLGKFIIPSITPTMDTTSVVEQKMPKVKMPGMINNDTIGSTGITTTNYLEILVPKHLFIIQEIKIQTSVTRGGEDNCMMSCTPTPIIIRREFTKGQKFIIAHVSTDDDRIYIFGVVES